MAGLDYLEVGPKKGASASVIWLHGLGADGNDFLTIAPELDLPASVRFVFPHAPHRPVTINGGYVMRAWYDILETGLSARQDEAGVRDSSHLIEDLIQKEIDAGVPASRIFLAGFSQGGAMTLFTGLRFPERLAGLVVLSAYLPVKDVTLAQARPENCSVPIFMSHGTFDPMVPLVLAEKSRDALLEKDYQIRWSTYPMAHSVCGEQIAELSDWMKARLV